MERRRRFGAQTTGAYLVRRSQLPRVVREAAALSTPRVPFTKSGAGILSIAFVLPQEAVKPNE
eukprot:2441997-Pyramimonas_sp.AAC.2